MKFKDKKLCSSNQVKEVLSEGILELLQSRKLSKIKVSELCEKCNLNRSSFYDHFGSKFELVAWTLDVYISSRIGVEKYFLRRDTQIKYYEFMKENAKLWKNIYDLNCFDKLLKAIVAKAITDYYRYFDVLSYNISKEEKAALELYVIGITVMDRGWILDGCKESIEKIIDYQQFAFPIKDY